ncbi:BolA family transcriptional regulator [Methylonatrum kenyense]|nr:BolA family protein [Methylonatrum kenyense]MCK8515949.1 BolA family transcriptional regulator [Methylonatrum kenyense]
MQRIEQRIRAALPVSHIDIEDESHLHAGHAGARDGRGHFNLLVVSEAFAGKSPLQRHRLVNEAVGDMFETDIHALSIRAQTDAERAERAQDA